MNQSGGHTLLFRKAVHTQLSGYFELWTAAVYTQLSGARIHVCF